MLVTGALVDLSTEPVEDLHVDAERCSQGRAALFGERAHGITAFGWFEL